ncbi:MAG: tetratricopeptide repeat protein [Myxococcales bacterium]|nr:tetratricopeptide repeat protein [Myxococcales bacterium]
MAPIAEVALDPEDALPPMPTQVGAEEKGGAADLSKGAAKLLAAGNVADAEDMFKRALTYDPNNLAALQGMYSISVRRGQHDEALEFAERMVANAPQRAQAHVLAGDAAFALDQIDDARRSWGRAAALGSKPGAAKLAKLDATHPPAPRPSAPVDAEVDAPTPTPKEPSAADDDEPEAPSAGATNEGATAVSRG